MVIRRGEEGVIFRTADNMLFLDLKGVCTMVTFSNSLNSSEHLCFIHFYVHSYVLQFKEEVLNKQAT